jgi:hypothetical protein
VLETINVDEGDGQRPAITIRVFERAIERGREVPPVENAGHVVALGKLLDLARHIQQLLLHLTRRVSNRASALIRRQISIPSKSGSPRSSRQISHRSRSSTSRHWAPVEQAITSMPASPTTFRASDRRPTPWPIRDPRAAWGGRDG